MKNGINRRYNIVNNKRYNLGYGKNVINKPMTNQRSNNNYYSNRNIQYLNPGYNYQNNNQYNYRYNNYQNNNQCNYNYKTPLKRKPIIKRNIPLYLILEYVFRGIESAFKY